MKIEAKRIVEVNPEDAVLLVNCDLPDDFDIEVARASGLIVTDNVEVYVLRGWRSSNQRMAITEPVEGR